MKVHIEFNKKYSDQDNKLSFYLNSNDKRSDSFGWTLISSFMIDIKKAQIFCIECDRLDLKTENQIKEYFNIKFTTYII